MAQLRCSILPIRIETGRFTNIRDPITGKLKKMKSTERICQLCTKNEIENEIHFLCVCPIYEHLRFLLYSEVVELVPTMTAEHRFILLVTKYQKNVCKFVSSAWEVRKSCLFAH